MVKTKKKRMIVGGVLIVAVIAVWFIVSEQSSRPGQYDSFAQCITEKGAVFYGAFWCPHCNTQKEMFGTSMSYVNYVECSTPDGRGQTQPCMDKNIEGYPTWEFADGTRVTGAKSLQELALRTGCTI